MLSRSLPTRFSRLLLTITLLLGGGCSESSRTARDRHAQDRWHPIPVSGTLSNGAENNAGGEVVPASLASAPQARPAGAPIPASWPNASGIFERTQFALSGEAEAIHFDTVADTGGEEAPLEFSTTTSSRMGRVKEPQPSLHDAPLSTIDSPETVVFDDSPTADSMSDDSTTNAIPSDLPSEATHEVQPTQYPVTDTVKSFFGLGGAPQIGEAASTPAPGSEVNSPNAAPSQTTSTQDGSTSDDTREAPSDITSSEQSDQPSDSLAAEDVEYVPELSTIPDDAPLPPTPNAATGKPSVLAGQLPSVAAESEPITLHFQEVEVRKALEMLSRVHGMNILVAPGVTGKVTANLTRVDEQAALNALLRLCNLVSYREGDLIFVYSPKEFPVDNAEMQVFPLDYVSGEAITEAVNGLLSPAGKAYVTSSSPTDNRLNQEVLVVVDAPTYVHRISQYVAQMDQAPGQVMIEAHVLSVELKDDYRHGVNIKKVLSIANRSFQIDIRGMADGNSAPGVVARLSGTDVDTLIECLKTTTDAKTLASPRVMALNEQTARIQIGEQLGYKVVTVTQTAAVEDVRFLKVGVVLEVTPRITRDGRVIMRVSPKVSSGQINPTTLLPEEATTEVETDVFLEDGQGMVIGGLIQENDDEVHNKVPLLGDLRFVGKVFRKTTRAKARNEVIVTLVPHIVTNCGNATERDEFDAMRSMTPLFHGPLERYPRPWEPSLAPSSSLIPHHCGGAMCRGQHCRCQCHACVPAPTVNPVQHAEPERFESGAAVVPIGK